MEAKLTPEIYHEQIGLSIAGVLYTAQRLAQFVAMLGILLMLVFTIIVVLSVGIGLGYHYHIVKTHTHDLDIKEYLSLLQQLNQTKTTAAPEGMDSMEPEQEPAVLRSPKPWYHLRTHITNQIEKLDSSETRETTGLTDLREILDKRKPWETPGDLESARPTETSNPEETSGLTNTGEILNKRKPWKTPRDSESARPWETSNTMESWETSRPEKAEETLEPSETWETIELTDMWET